MHYPDLENYRFEDKEFSHLKNIGWLDITHDFVQGDIDKKLLQKLHFLTGLMYQTLEFEPKRSEYKKAGKPILIVHTNFMRMLPFKCPFCKCEIAVKTEDGKDVQLGRNEMEIPSIKGDYLYNFPTMLHHYISEHQYLPPIEFLESLQAFDLTKDFDCTDFYNQLEKKKFQKIAKTGSRVRGLELVKKLQQIHGDN